MSRAMSAIVIASVAREKKDATMFAGCQNVASVECHIPDFRRFNKSRLPSERKTIANRKMLPKDAFLRLCLLRTCRVVPYTEINITDGLMVPTPYDESIF